MNKQMVLFTSIFLSVLMLLIIGGVVKSVAARQEKASVSPELQAQIDQREADFAAQMEVANNQIKLLSDQLQTQQIATVTSNISPEKAASIALETFGDNEALLQLPELVSYEGKTAYQVTLTDGVLFIDAVSGLVLFNGVPELITPEQAAEIAGVYLGGMDPRYSTVEIAVSNGNEVFKVTFNDYIVYVDKFGNVVQAQVLQYANNSGSSNGNSSGGSYVEHHDDDDHDEHDDD